MRRYRATLGLLTCLLWAPPAPAFQKPAPRDRVLPDFDSRLRALSAKATATTGQGRESLAVLRSRLANPLRVSTHPITGAARLLWAEGEPLSAAAPSARAATRAFLQENGSLLGLAEAGPDSLVFAREERLLGGVLTRLVLEQVVEGIPVFEGVVIVHVDSLGRVVKVATGPLHRGRGQGEPAPRPALTAEGALERAVADVRPELRLTPRRRPDGTGASSADVFEAGPLGREAVVEPVWFPTAEGDRLAFRVRVVPSGFPQAYDIVVDAESGAILYRRNRVRYAEGAGTVPQSDEAQLGDPRRPDEHPLGSNPSGASDPPGGCPPPLGYVSRSLDGPFRDPDSVLALGGRLRGNNTHVYRTTEGAFGALGTLDGGSWHFDFPMGAAASVETALFFSTNFAHDFFYDLGFDEAAGNFQADNFGRGGVGGDALTTLARANGRNNATFEPAAEGQSPTMSLFLFDGSGCWAQDLDGDGAPDLDGGYDTDVVIHEYHHGVSWRLNPNFAGVEADAIGEGGGDFFAYSLSGNTELAEFSVPPLGIRAVNEKTYADFACLFFFFCEPHDNGEIWANVLWDLREAFRSDAVGGSEAAGISLLHRLYLDGLALSPPAPTMLDLRDAMIQADLLRNPAGAPGGSENHCRMWTAFAGRGMGSNALDTNDTGDNTVVGNDELPPACPQPIRVSLSVADPQAAEAGLAPGSFTVIRTGDTSAELTVLYTVGGTAAAGVDYEALPGSVTLPPGASTASILVTPRDDPAYELAETVIVTLAADAAYELKSPVAGTVTVSSDDPGPDVVVSALTAPSPTGAGLTMDVSDTTRNQGAGTAPASTTVFYLSTNGIVDTADVLLASRSVPPLAPAAVHSASTPLTIPTATTPGNYYVIARADDGAAFLETNEANNTRSALVVVGPDLTVSAFTAPASAGAGATLSVSDTTKNQGGGAAPESSTRFFLSTNASYDATDLLLGARFVPALAPGAVHAGATSLTLPPDLPGGSYYLIARADGDQLVPESSEANNTRAALVAVGADVVVSALAAPSPTGAGLTMDVSDTTRNQGAGTAPASTTVFYLSTNGIVDTADVLLASRSVPPLAPAAVHSASTPLTIPTATTPGNYYVIARADDGAAFLETNEANNTRSALVVVGPDLTVSAFTAPASAGAGATLSVSDTTKNQGGGAAPESSTRFFLSTNSSYDATDLLLGARLVPALPPGAVHAGATSLTLPPDLPGGSYYLIARADGDSALLETSEVNNTRSNLVLVGPDLTVSVFTAPASAGAGATLSVSDTTKNQGGGAAPESSTRFFLSPNASYDATDLLLGTRVVPALPPGAVHAGATSLTLPPDLPGGSYYLIARADGGDLVAETSEANNTRTFFITIGPDVVVSALTAPSPTGAGLTLIASDTTRNQGAGTAPASTTAFYLSPNALLDAADILLASRSVPELPPGAASTGSTSLTIPTGTAAGNYYVLARADDAFAFGETNETNNTRSALVVVGPDLAVSLLAAPSSAVAGATIPVSDTTRNLGGGAAPGSTTRFLLSINALVDASDVALGSRPVAALAPSAAEAGSTLLTLPPGTGGGTYYILARADGDDLVGETSEANNVRAVVIAISPSP